MTRGRAPEWLADFQERFGSVITTPLDRTSGTLTARTDRYDPAVGALPGPRAPAEHRLAVYNRQYWFRLFEVLQFSFPLTTRLIGHWKYNALAASFLSANTPKSWDIDRVADGFEGFVARVRPGPELGIDSDAVVEAAYIDAAHRRVFRAPAVLAFRPGARDAEQLLTARLVPSPAMAILHESWPLLELRRTLGATEGEAPLALPPRLAEPRHFALLRHPEGFVTFPLEAREAELFELLLRGRLADALAELEARCSEAERGSLPERAQRWLARSVELGFWIGLETPQQSTQL
ncbi:MAG: putative DNA-binding domain-containing protein [Polyangiaceae bacterium]